ncbi:MAG: DNA methyltransferase [Anaerolineae bacterium]
MTNEGDWVLDPFIGVGTTAIAALMHKRRAIGAKIMHEYVEIARERVRLAESGALRIRPMARSVYDPDMPDLSIPRKSCTLERRRFSLNCLKRARLTLPRSKTNEGRV